MSPTWRNPFRSTFYQWLPPASSARLIIPGLFIGGALFGVRGAISVIRVKKVR